MPTTHVVTEGHSLEIARRERSTIVERVCLTVAALMVTGTVSFLIALAFIAYSKSNAPTGGGG